MSEPDFQQLVGTLRARLQAELAAGLDTMIGAHQRGLEEARRTAETGAETRWTALLDQARTEGAASAAALAATRAELDLARTTWSGLPQRLAAYAAELDRQGTVSDVLDTILAHGRASAGRADLFIVSGTRLERWSFSRAADAARKGGTDPADTTDGLDTIAADASMGTDAVRRDGAIAVPLVLDGIPVAVLVARDGQTPGDAGWMDAVEVIARMGAARLAALTASRTLRARRWTSFEPSTTGTASVPPDKYQEVADGAEGARRFARLLLSEVKMYNEASVRAGREQRDLMRRLGPEIERARRLYEQRVPVTLASRAQHFHEELVRTLAEGDPSLLG